HRFIKKITKPMMGFKAFYSANATIAGIETAHMIRKGQLSEENIPAYKAVYGISRIVLPPG
ncbi:MAG: DDE-type integrase/transposase/recombinase, partial [Methylobacter sp.]|nr:DDE-type integrase/transposase/recombinase [Methylobacter sp.]